MLRATKKLLEHKYNAYIISSLLTLVVIYLSLSSLEGVSLKIPVSEKILDALAYFVLTFGWFLAVKIAHEGIRLNSFTLALVIVFLNITFITGVYERIPVSDKISHAIAYFALTISWFFAVKKTHGRVAPKLVIIGAIFIFGIIIEVLQEYVTSNRMLDFKDIIANTVGVLTAFGLFRYLLKGYKMI